VDPVLAARPVLRLHLGRLAKSAAQALFALISGEIPTDADTTVVLGITRHRPVPAVLPAGHPGADIGQHVELRRLIFPFLLIYLNSKLPKTARPKTWTYVVLAAQLRLRPAHGRRSSNSDA
jgi:hypothetical protein